MGAGYAGYLDGLCRPPVCSRLKYRRRHSAENGFPPAISVGKVNKPLTICFIFCNLRVDAANPMRFVLLCTIKEKQ